MATKPKKVKDLIVGTDAVTYTKKVISKTETTTEWILEFDDGSILRLNKDTDPALQVEA